MKETIRRTNLENGSHNKQMEQFKSHRKYTGPTVKKVLYTKNL